MFIVRNSFRAKPGHATKLAALLADVAATAGMPGFRVMTDVTGDFNSVVFEYQAESLGEFESRMQEYQSNPLFREKMAGYTDHWETGKREVFRVHAAAAATATGR
jgi:hypothetical protein